MLSFDDARARLLSEARPVAEIQMLDTLEASGRVLAVVQKSPLALPPADCSMVDGYAVRVVDVLQANGVLPVSQRIVAGEAALPLVAGSAARIFTGAPLPAGADAIVMQEVCDAEAAHVRIRTIPSRGAAIRRQGEEMPAGAMLLQAGVRLYAPEIALAASVGLARLPVFRRVKVALFSTGNELVMPGNPLPPGHIYNANRFLLYSLLQALGCEVTDRGNIPDCLETTRQALRDAAGVHDLILTSGGVSVGEEDHVKPALEAEGKLTLWKIAMKPGKPLALGHIGETAFIGLPGNPVSALATFVLMVRPFILAMQGVKALMSDVLHAPAAFEWPRPDPRREFLRARLNAAGEIEIFPNQGAAALQSVVWATGLVDIPAATPVVKGDRLSFIPFSSLLH